MTTSLLKRWPIGIGLRLGMVLFLVGAGLLPARAATLLPYGKLCFDDANGQPLGGGNVGYYIPGTLTPKDTYQDAAQTVLNTNPVLLDSAGCSITYGVGSYRQIVKDHLGNTVADVLTADTSYAQGGPAGFIPPGGRLTLISGQPVPGNDVTATGTVYYTPYTGNSIQVWNGSALVSYSFPELVQTLDANSGDANYQAANTNVDEFVVADPVSSPATLRLCSGPRWTSDAVRDPAYGIERTSQGLLANGAAMQCRYGNASGSVLSVAKDQGTWVGTLRIGVGVAGQTFMILNPPAANGGNPAVVGVWNAYNRVLVKAVVQDSGGAYTYASTTQRFAHGTGLNAISFVSGFPLDGFVMSYYQRVDTAAVAGAWAAYGIGVDAPTYYSGIYAIVWTTAAASQISASTITYMLSPQVGWHAIYGVENSNGSAQTFNTQYGTLQIAVFM